MERLLIYIAVVVAFVLSLGALNWFFGCHAGKSLTAWRAVFVVAAVTSVVMGFKL